MQNKRIKLSSNFWVENMYREFYDKTPLEKEAMSQDLAVASAKIGVAESLHSGVTTVYDMYYYADALATCYEEMGMRAFVAQTIVNQNICDQENEQHGLDLAKKFYEKWLKETIPPVPSSSPVLQVPSSRSASQRSQMVVPPTFISYSQDGHVSVINILKASSSYPLSANAKRIYGVPGNPVAI